MREYLREAGVLLFIKFVAVPGSVYLLGLIWDLGMLTVAYH